MRAPTVLASVAQLALVAAASPWAEIAAVGTSTQPFASEKIIWHWDDGRPPVSANFTKDDCSSVPGLKRVCFFRWPSTPLLAYYVLEGEAEGRKHWLMPVLMNATDAGYDRSKTSWKQAKCTW